MQNALKTKKNILCLHNQTFTLNTHIVQHVIILSFCGMYAACGVKLNFLLTEIKTNYKQTWPIIIHLLWATYTHTHTDRNRRAKRLDLNLLISQQHPNDLNISFNARPTTLGFFQGVARTPIFTTKYNKFQHVYPLYFERFFQTHTHTHLSACLVLYPNFARIRVSSFRNTPVCVCTKCARKFFPACYFHYFPAGVVCVYGGKGKLCHG